MIHLFITIYNWYCKNAFNRGDFPAISCGYNPIFSHTETILSWLDMHILYVYIYILSHHIYPWKSHKKNIKSPKNIWISMKLTPKEWGFHPSNIIKRSAPCHHLAMAAALRSLLVSDAASAAWSKGDFVEMAWWFKGIWTKIRKTGESWWFHDGINQMIKCWI